MAIETHVIGSIVAGIFALFAIICTGAQIYLHYAYNNNRLMRMRTMRIIAMVIVYCIDSWFGLVFKSSELYIDTLRDCYEAFVIYTFFQMIIEYLNGEDETIRSLQKMEQRKHVIPFCCLRDWKMGADFYHMCKIGVLQYVPVKVFCTVLTLILSYNDVYCDGNFSMSCGFIYVAFLTNASQIWALYCLVLFYVPLQSTLQPMKAVAKFLTIKLVVFLTWWQMVLIASLEHFDVIEPTDEYSAKEISTGINDFLICIEMAAVSITHIYAFPPKEFAESEAKRIHRRALDDFVSVVNVMDIATDLRDAVPRKNTPPVEVSEMWESMEHVKPINDGLGRKENAMEMQTSKSPVLAPLSPTADMASASLVDLDLSASSATGSAADPGVADSGSSSDAGMFVHERQNIKYKLLEEDGDGDGDRDVPSEVEPEAGPGVGVGVTRAQVDEHDKSNV